MATPTRRILAAALTMIGVTAATTVAGAGIAAAEPTSTTMHCSSLNPLFWAPSFTWNVTASSGASLPPGGAQLEPSLLLSGGNELPAPPGGLIPALGVNWYGNRVLVDWTNRNTGQSGHSVSDETWLQQKPGIPINRTWTGVGVVDFTVTVQTGAGWWFLNPQNAICRGTVQIVD